MFRTTLALTAALALALPGMALARTGGNAAVAGFDDGETEQVSITVSLAGLDGTSAAGRAAIARRVALASAALCDAVVPQSPGDFNAAERACRADARAQADAQLNTATRGQPVVASAAGFKAGGATPRTLADAR